MIAILGGGLAGLSTAYHLGSCPHQVFEADRTPGGLCRSRQVAGFVFDWTGHLLHVRDPRTANLVEALLPGAFREIDRRAYIWTRGARLAFPFQANLHGLPLELVARCLTGFVESLGRAVPAGEEASFRDWSLSVFGQGISDAFMFPYNAKLFRREAVDMTADWVSWAVPRPKLAEVIRGALGIENRSMGYNATFRYPNCGGIGILPQALAARVPNLRCGARVKDVDLEGRTLRLVDGETIRWDRLVVTIPLPRFLEMSRGGPDWLRGAASKLDWSVVGCLNLGVARPGLGEGAHWIYFPDPQTPYYRVGFPSNFSDTVAPPGTSSLYVEFGFRKDDSFDSTALEEAALAGLRRDGILRGDDRILVRDWIRIDPGYVIFDRERRETMARLVPELESRGVHLIGRYGAWTYSYMERALLDGLELASRLGVGVVEGART